jgi:hypothetical protein
MGGRYHDFEFQKRISVPGPGMYENKSMATIPTAKFGSGPRMMIDNSSKGKPGPGAYQEGTINLLKRSPNYGFGSENRNGPEFKQPAIGPGSY